MKTTQAVIGKWPNVLSMLGVNAEYLSGKHTTCPICTNGKDKFRFDNKEGRGTYFCNDCGAGDGWKLLNLIHGWEFKEAANQIDKVLHKATDSPVKATENLKTTRARLRQIQRRIEPLNESGNVYKYLSNRDICRDGCNCKNGR
jgi:putative DNA primase/helicase